MMSSRNNLAREVGVAPTPVSRFWRRGGSRCLFVVRPHPQHLDDAFFFEHLIYEPMLDIDPAGVGAFQITKKLLEGRWLLEGISGKQREKLFGLRAETRGCKPASILLRLPGKDNLPRLHQPGSFSHSSTGVASPSRTDSRMPGTDSR